MSTVTALISRVEAEIAAGRPWRAKEILRGNLAVTWQAGVAERYGRLLLDLGDHLDAGRFLFASGVRTAEYEGPIALFVRRHRRSGADNFLAQLPRSFRRQSFDVLPQILQRELEGLGVRKKAFGVPEKGSTPPSTLYTRVTGAVAVSAGLLMLVSLFVGIGVGFRQIVSWVAGWFR